MLNKTTTLVLLASLTAAQGIFASDVTKDLGSDALSSPRVSSSAIPVDENDFSSSVGVFANLDNIELEDLEKVTDIYSVLKDVDQNANKYAGQKTKQFFDEKVPGGKTLTWIASIVAKKAFGTETLTEGILNVVRKPLKIDPKDYPTTSEGIIGLKIKLLVNLIPGGDKITAVAGKAGKVFFETDTLTEGLLKAFISAISKKPQEFEAEIETSTEKVLAANKPEIN